MWIIPIIFIRYHPDYPGAYLDKRDAQAAATRWSRPTSASTAGARTRCSPSTSWRTSLLPVKDAGAPPRGDDDDSGRGPDDNPGRGPD